MGWKKTRLQISSFDNHSAFSIVSVNLSQTLWSFGQIRVSLNWVDLQLSMRLALRNKKLCTIAKSGRSSSNKSKHASYRESVCLKNTNLVKEASWKFWDNHRGRILACKNCFELRKRNLCCPQNPATILESKFSIYLFSFNLKKTNFNFGSTANGLFNSRSFK